MQAKFFTYITPVLELARQDEHHSAAEVLQHIANIIILSEYFGAELDRFAAFSAQTLRRS